MVQLLVHEDQSAIPVLVGIAPLLSTGRAIGLIPEIEKVGAGNKIALEAVERSVRESARWSPRLVEEA
jgi:hypothetical protein